MQLSPSDILTRYGIKPKIRIDDYRRQHSKIYGELLKEFNHASKLQKNEVWGYVKKFEKRFAKYHAIPYATGTNSGTSALQLTLTALGIGEGDEIITASNTYVGVLLAILNTGAVPVLIDVDEETYNIDSTKIEENITERTKGILPIHAYGQMCDMRAIRKIANKHKLKVIEDAAQAHGAMHLNKRPGYYSDAACFSFHTTKNLGGYGNGGMVICKNKRLKKALETLRDPSSNSKFLLKSKRTPAYLDEAQVIFLNVKLSHLDEWIKRKREIAKTYNEKLNNQILPYENPGSYHTYHDYVIRVKRREPLRIYMLLKGIETAVHFKIPLHLLEVYRHIKQKSESFPVAEKLTKEILSIPVNPFLTKKEVSYIVSCLNKFRL